MKDLMCTVALVLMWALLLGALVTGAGCIALILYVGAGPVVATLYTGMVAVLLIVNVRFALLTVRR